MKWLAKLETVKLDAVKLYTTKTLRQYLVWLMTTTDRSAWCGKSSTDVGKEIDRWYNVSLYQVFWPVKLQPPPRHHVLPCQVFKFQLLICSSSAVQLVSSSVKCPVFPTVLVVSSFSFQVILQSIFFFCFVVPSPLRTPNVFDLCQVSKSVHWELCPLLCSKFSILVFTILVWDESEIWGSHFTWTLVRTGKSPAVAEHCTMRRQNGTFAGYWVKQRITSFFKVRFEVCGFASQLETLLCFSFFPCFHCILWTWSHNFNRINLSWSWRARRFAKAWICFPNSTCLSTAKPAEIVSPLYLTEWRTGISLLLLPPSLNKSGISRFWGQWGIYWLPSSRCKSGNLQVANVLITIKLGNLPVGFGAQGLNASRGWCSPWKSRLLFLFAVNWMGNWPKELPQNSTSCSFMWTKVEGFLLWTMSDLWVLWHFLLQLNILQYFFSRGVVISSEDEFIFLQRISAITSTLQYSLEGSFKDGLEQNDSDVLRRCLRTYATIDKMTDAENLFRQHTVKPFIEEVFCNNYFVRQVRIYSRFISRCLALPYLQSLFSFLRKQVITEQFLASHPNGLAGMYDVVLDFIPSKCKCLRDITSGGMHGWDHSSASATSCAFKPCCGLYFICGIDSACNDSYVEPPSYLQKRYGARLRLSRQRCLARTGGEHRSEDAINLCSWKPQRFPSGTVSRFRARHLCENQKLFYLRSFACGLLVLWSVALCFLRPCSPLDDYILTEFIFRRIKCGCVSLLWVNG